MGAIRPGKELGVELHTHHEGMPYYLADLHQLAVRRYPAGEEAYILLCLSEGIINLKTVTVPFVYQGLGVRLVGQAAL